MIISKNAEIFMEINLYQMKPAYLAESQKSL